MILIWYILYFNSWTPFHHRCTREFSKRIWKKNSFEKLSWRRTWYPLEDGCKFFRCKNSGHNSQSKFVKWLFYKENAVRIWYDNGGVLIATSRVWQAISPCQSETLRLEAWDTITNVYSDRSCIWQPYLPIH